MSVALSLSYMRFSSCREKGDAMTVRHSLCEEEYKTSSLPASFMSCCFPVFLSTSPGLSPPWEGRESTSDGCQVPGTVLGAWGQQWRKRSPCFRLERKGLTRYLSSYLYCTVSEAQCTVGTRYIFSEHGTRILGY